MARPLKEKTPCTRVFAWRATEEEGAKMDALIAASGYKASEFQRQVFLENKPVIAPSKRPFIPKQKRSIDEQKILFLLAQLGNNVNQIAHQLNAAHKAGIVSPHLYQEILEQLEAATNTAREWRP